LTRELSVKDRKGVVGCSDLGAFFGVSPFGGLYSVWQSYMGQGKDEPSEEAKESMAMGTFFEGPIRDYFCGKLGIIARKVDEAYCQEGEPRLICHPDALVVGLVEGKRIALEIKLVSPVSKGWGEPETAEVPDHYYLQCQGYYACSVPCDEVWLIRMRGNRVSRYVVPRDEEVIRSIREIVPAVLDKWDAGEVPSPETAEEAAGRWPVGIPDSAVVADEAALALIGDRNELKASIKSLQEDLERTELELKCLLQDKERIVSGEGKTLVSWRTQKRVSFDSRALREAEPETYEKFKRESNSRVFR